MTVRAAWAAGLTLTLRLKPLNQYVSEFKMRRPWGSAPLRSSTDARLTPSPQSDRLARPASGFPSAEGARGLMTAIPSDDIPHCRALVSVQYSLPSALDLLELEELYSRALLYGTQY
jgi:hypothetical protein